MKKNINYIIALSVIFIFKFYFEYDLLSSIAVGIFSYWLSALLIRANNSLPIKELFLSMYSLQYLFGAALTYNGMDTYNSFENQMRFPSDAYFMNVIPMFFSICFGFNVYSKKNTFTINRDNINDWLNEYPKAPYYFIAIGFLSSFSSGFFPSSLNFIVYILSGFKYIGLFILIMSYRTIKPALMVLIYGSILISSFQGGMFHDLMTWIIIAALILTYRYKPNWKYKIIGMFVFGLFAIFIQSIKSGLREQTWFGNKETSISLVEDVTKEVTSDNGGLLSINNIGPNIIRINQGWVLASSFDYVPRVVEHTNGELVFDYLYAAIVPRIFDDDKLKSGGHDLVNKYAGRDIAGSTSVAMGLFTDAYVDFGFAGSIICIFLFGLLYGYILNQFYVNSSKYPILILLVTVAFIYPIRPDTDTGSALGNLFKTIILLWIIIRLYPKFFKISTIPETNLHIK